MKKSNHELEIIEEVIHDHWLGLYAMKTPGPSQGKTPTGRPIIRYLAHQVDIYWAGKAFPELIRFRVQFDGQYVHFRNATEDNSGMILWLADPDFFKKAREIITQEFVERIKSRSQVHKSIFRKFVDMKKLKELNRLIREHR